MKTKLNCIIVDDEPLSQNLIKKFIARVPYLTLVGTYDNAIAALQGVTSLKPDIVFLDINMPEMTGIEFLRSFIGEKPNIVFITAHQEYAIQGFEHDAVDYLLKPIAFDRFMKAINKVVKRKIPEMDFIQQDKGANISKGGVGGGTVHTNDFFMVKADKKLIKVALKDIIYVEGMKDYVKIHMTNQLIITHMTMTKMMSLLPENLFIRINRSFIVQLAFIKHMEGNMIETSHGQRLTIGVNYREGVRESFKGWTIQ